MAKLSVVTGTTSKMVDIFVQDSSSTTGSGLTGLVFNSASLVAYYHRDTDSAATAITLATMTVGTWATGGFKEVSSSNMPGIYQIGIPNAALASGATSVVIMLKGATNMAPVALEVELTAWNNQDAVHGGLSALPNAAAAATGGLPTVDSSNAVKLQSGTGSNQISLSSGLVTLAGVTHTGATIPTVTTTTTATNVTTVNGLASGVITATSIAADAITAAKIADGAIDAATFAAGAINAAAIAADAITDAKVASDVTIASVTGAVGSVTGNVGGNVVGSVGSVTTVSDKTGYSLSSGGIQAIWDALTSALTTSGSIGKLIVDNLNATISSVYSRIGAPVGASISADIAAVQADTDNIQTRLPAALSGGKMDAVAAISGASETNIINGVVSGVGSASSIVAADIWSYTAGSGRTLTSVTPGSSLVATTTGSDLSLTKAVSYETTITGLTIPSTWTKIYFTAKTSLGDADSHAMLQLQESNPSDGADGLLYINGGTAVAAGVTAADGDLAVDRVAGTVTITLTDDAAVQLSTGSGLAYDVKMLTSDSKSQVLVTGNLSIGTTPTLSVS